MSFDINLFLNSAFLIFAVLGLASLAGYFCERVGIVNIAIDGQMIFGALMFSIFGMLFNRVFGDLNGVEMLLPLLISLIFSVALSSIFGSIIIKLKANHAITGTAINLLVAGVATFITAPLGEAISDGLHPKLKVDLIPSWKIADNFYGETILIIVLALIVIGIAIFIMSKTRFGLRMKAIGDNPNAVDAQGVNVNKYKWYGVMISGLFAAAAGSIFILGGPSMYPQSTYFEGNVAGLGFLAIAVVVAGSWRIPFITIASFVFASLMSATNILATNPKLINVFGQYARYISKAIPFVCSLVVLIIFSKKSFGPKALGKNFDKTLR